jgi:transcriptional regulator with XRE-family HTH domain
MEAILSSPNEIFLVALMDSPSGPLPFRLRLRKLREERGLSQESLARATHAEGQEGLSVQSVAYYERGRQRPSRSHFEKLARGLGVDPNEWPEYRLAVWRESLDEKIVGLDVALTILAKIEGATPEGVVPPPPEGILHSQKSAAPSARDPKRPSTRKAARR